MEIKGKVVAVCISEEKGVQKTNVGKANLVENWGLEKDAHAGDWHRQVSLLSADKVNTFKDETGVEIADGDFGENLLIEGIDLGSLPVGTILKCGDVELEVTQIGKECHHGCRIKEQVGSCIMPTQGIFAKVSKGGMVTQGDEIVCTV